MRISRGLASVFFKNVQAIIFYDDLQYERVLTKMMHHWQAALLAVVVAIALLQLTHASTASPWPYLQVYPAVDENDDRTPLYFALMLSFGGDYTSIGALPAVQIALDYINNEPSILPGYSLHYTLTDSQVCRTIVELHIIACMHTIWHIHIIICKHN